MNKTWNLYLLIIASLTISQMIYDFALIFALLLFKFGNVGVVIYSFLNEFGWNSATIWTNVLSFILFYTIFYLRSINITKNYKKYLFFVYGSALLLSVTLITISEEELSKENRNNPISNLIVVSFRIASIFINIMLYLAITLKLKKMGVDENQALYVLANRLKYYSVVLVLARLFASPYEIFYHPDATIDNPADVSLIQTIICLFAYIFTR